MVSGAGWLATKLIIWIVKKMTIGDQGSISVVS